MKKILIITLMVLLTISCVFAINGNGEGSRERNSLEERTQLREQITEKINSNLEKISLGPINGLTNAYAHVNNEQAKEKIMNALEKFQERRQERYEEMNAYEGERETTLIQTKRRARFLFFNFGITDEYEIDKEGKILKARKGLFSNFFPPNKIVEE